MSTEKRVIFYYSYFNERLQKLVYRCLDMNDKLENRYTLDYSIGKYFPMNSAYKKCDKDLYTFRDERVKENGDIVTYWVRKSDGSLSKFNLFKYYSVQKAIYNFAFSCSDQDIIKSMAPIRTREFELLENCLSCGLISLEKLIQGVFINSYGYDFEKFYYHMMRKIRVPMSPPIFQVILELDFNNLKFGIYRVKVICDSKKFWNIFKFNNQHHYNYTTLKSLYKAKDKYNITFKLLEPDELYNYNFVHYEQTVELKVVFKHWFKAFDDLLKKFKGNTLIKTYVSQTWSTLSKYKKIRVSEEDACEYSFGHIDKVATHKYEYYSLGYENGIFEFVNPDDAYEYKGLGRIKAFITEFSRNYMFNIINNNNLEKYVVRIQTDSVSFSKPVDFPSLKPKLDYYPIPEGKTTGAMTYYTANFYLHWCDDCCTEYKYDKSRIKKGLKCCECEC